MTTGKQRPVRQQIPCGDDNREATAGATADPGRDDNREGKCNGNGFYAVLMIVILFEDAGFAGRFCTGCVLRGVSAYKTASMRLETPSLS